MEEMARSASHRPEIGPEDQAGQENSAPDLASDLVPTELLPDGEICAIWKYVTARGRGLSFPSRCFHSSSITICNIAVRFSGGNGTEMERKPNHFRSKI
jgi:hypothetical protein